MQREVAKIACVGVGNSSRGELPSPLVDFFDLLFKARSAEIAVLLGKTTWDSRQATHIGALITTEPKVIVLSAVGGRVHSLHLKQRKVEASLTHAPLHTLRYLFH